MSPFHPDLSLALGCYRKECPLSCPNNTQVEVKLSRVMAQYATLPNTWEDRFFERREKVNKFNIIFAT